MGKKEPDYWGLRKRRGANIKGGLKNRQSIAWKGAGA